METAGFYLLRSAVWITGFALVYLLFLRNERFFVLNRIYLLTGILASVILPLVTVRYVVEVSAVEAGAEAGPVTAVLHGSGTWQNIMAVALFTVWLTGALAVLLRYAVQVMPVLRAAREADRQSGYPVKVIRSDYYPGSFSLFSLVVVNPSVTETEAREIMNHEMVHIRQMHWFDLVLSSLLCAVQWFNPAAWIYARLVRQNHEYLADEEALQRTSDPAVYRAVLLNQIAGSPVIDLGNFFSYSLNKKRFLMMKNKISSPYRKLRVLLILPVAALVLFAFAKPEYRLATGPDEPVSAAIAAANAVKSVSGTVKDEAGKPLEGAVILIKGTTRGTTSDASGRFALKDVPDDAVLVVSFVGYETNAISVKAAGTSLSVTMRKSTVVTDTVNVGPVPPPPPPPPPLPPVTTKGKAEAVPEAGQGERDVFVVVEEMPQFPGGGMDAMIQWIAQHMKYPEQAKKDGIQGTVFVGYIVNKAGKVESVEVESSAHPLLDAEAVRVVAAMPDWTPGTQRGKAVDVRLVVPIKFSLK
jgi:TonB family protein